MSLSQLPTDNLYKFMALSGLLLFVASIAYPMQLYRDLKLQSIDLGTRAAVTGRELEQVTSAITRLQRKKGPLDQNEVDALERANNAAGVKNLQLEGDVKKINFLADQLSTISAFAVAGVTLGGLLSWFGFALWYRRVQRPLDEAAMAPAKSQADT